MPARRPEPEPEHDARRRRGARARSSSPTGSRSRATRSPSGSSAGNGLREQRPRRASTPMTSDEHRGGEARAEPAADRREHDPEPEERAVRDRLVERVPAPIGDDRPRHRHAGPQRRAPPPRRRARAPERPTRGTGSRPKRDRDERAREQDDRGAADGQDPADVRPVAGEHRTEQRRDRRTRRAPSRRPDGGSDAGSMAGHASRSRLRTPRSHGAATATQRPLQGLAQQVRAADALRRAGYPAGASNKSFTLPTPSAHPVPEDSPTPGLPAAPREISARDNRTALLRTFVALARARPERRRRALDARARPAQRRRAGRRCSPTGSTTAASTASIRSTATRRRSTRSRTTSATTRTPRTSSRARSRRAPRRPRSRRTRPDARRRRSGPIRGTGATATTRVDTGDRPTRHDPQAAPDVDTSGPSSVPIPLLVLGGMSHRAARRRRSRIRLAPPPGRARGRPGRRRPARARAFAARRPNRRSRVE